MSVRTGFHLALVTCLLLCAEAARAEKLTKENRQWLDGVRAIILPEEEKQYRDLAKSERAEFEKIFWARRDPDLETPDNEYQAEFDELRAQADELYVIHGRRGSETDCGRAFILFKGEPDSVDQQTLDSQPGRRPPQVWTYLSRPGFTFPEGGLKVPFDAECATPRAMQEQLDRVAEQLVVNPNIGYSRDEKGKLVKLVDQLPKPSPAQALLKSPRVDFPIQVEKTLVLRNPSGGAFVAGLVQAEGADLGPSGEPLDLVVAAQARDAEGKVVPGQERETRVVPGPDGRFVVSYGLVLRAGDYTLDVAVVDPKGGKGAAASIPIKVPDLAAEGVSMSSLLVLQDIVPETSGQVDRRQPLADFDLTAVRLVPSFGNVFSKDQSISMLCAIYGGAVDPETGKASLKVSFVFKKGGKKVAQADDVTYDTPNPSHSVGPVPLSSFEPGVYQVEMKVKDQVANTESEQEAQFEIRE
jgi:GWxTD domain-containing protein